MRLFDRIEPTTLDRRDWQLSVVSLVIIVVLGVSLALLMYPAVFVSNEAPAGHTGKVLFLSFCALFVFTVTYLSNREYVVYKLRRSLVRHSGQIETLRRTASTDLLDSLGGFSHFQDQLTMSFRRAVQVRESFSLVFVRVEPSSKLKSPQEFSLALGDAARALVRKLRADDSLYRLSSSAFGIFLPNTAIAEMNRIVERVAEGLIDASDVGNRFTFGVGVVNYPQQASTAHEMERLAYSFSLSKDSA
jgi:GGDEF domain-containing protein